MQNEGSWYQVDRNFYESVERDYNDVGSSGINFISWRPGFVEGKEKFEKERYIMKDCQIQTLLYAIWTETWHI